MTLKIQKIISDRQELYNILILMLAFFMPLSRAMVSILTVLITLLWLSEGNFAKKFILLKRSRIAIGIFFYILLMTSSLFWSHDPIKSIDYLRPTLYFILAFAIGTKLQKDNIDKILTSLLMGLFISEILSYGIYFGFWTFKHASPVNPSPFMHHIIYSIYLSMGALIILIKLLNKKYSAKTKLVYLFFFLSVTANLFINGGRTGQIAFLLGLIILLFHHYKINIKTIAYGMLLIITIYATAYGLSPNFRTKLSQSISELQTIRNGNLKSSWGTRLAYWIVSYNILKQHPIIGNGLDYKYSITKELESGGYDKAVFPIEFMKKYQPHNQFLLISIQTGLIGLFIFLYIIFEIFKIDVKDDEIKELSLVFMTIFSIGFFSDSLLVKQFSLLLFILIVSILIRIELDNCKKGL